MKRQDQILAPHLVPKWKRERTPRPRSPEKQATHRLKAMFKRDGATGESLKVFAANTAIGQAWLRRKRVQANPKRRKRS